VIAFVGIKLHLDDGQEVRCRIFNGQARGAAVRCEGALCCSHDLSREQASQVFRSVGVLFDGSATRTATKVIKKKYARELFDAIHNMEPTLHSENHLLIPSSWNRAAIKDLLELYLTGFTTSMLADFFRVSQREVIRQLSSVVLGDDNLTADDSKGRHQRRWHRDELMYLASQMQLGRTPTEIAALMDRDSLSIAFKLFQELPVPIPRAVQAEYNITVRLDPLGHVPLDGEPF
jgi:hypothetical protein